MEILAGTSPEYGEGLSNHGPMAAQALMALHRPQAVVPWVQAYRSRLLDLPPSQAPIPRGEWQQALASFERVKDWIVFFRRELQQAEWQLVLRDWVPRLAPGLSGSGAHGLLRTAHAISSLSQEETAPRKAELAAGLGYWAARYLKLPGILGSSAAGALTPLQALSYIKWHHKRQNVRFRLISDGLRELAGYSPFTGVLNLVKLPDDPAAFISQVTDAMARVYLAHSHDPHALIAYLHAFTAASGLRDILPHLEPRGRHILLRHGWQFAGAIYAVFGQANPVDSFEVPREDAPALIDQAVNTGDEHAIKLTAACLREYSVNPNPVYLAVAWDAVSRLRSPETGSENGLEEEHPG